MSDAKYSPSIEETLLSTHAMIGSSSILSLQKSETRAATPTGTVEINTQAIIGQRDDLIRWNAVCLVRNHRFARQRRNGYAELISKNTAQHSIGHRHPLGLEQRP